MFGDSHLPLLLDIVRNASQKILEVYHKESITIDIKEDHSPVTQADRISDRYIDDSLKLLTPEIPIISEESLSVPYEERKNWSKLWLVDPLDGTREFIARTDDFSINIALIENHEPIFGLIHMPVSGLTYYAFKNKESFKCYPDGKIEKTQCRTLNPDKPIIIASRRHANNFPLQCFFDYVGDYERISRGSALKFGLIAEGSADIYPRFGETYEWDTAAGQCIVEAAGGHVVDTQMQPLRYNMRPTLINPHFFAVGDGLNYLTKWSNQNGKSTR